MKKANSKKLIAAGLPSLAATTLLLLPSAAAWAGTDTWTGNGGNPNWSNPANWSALPVADDTLLFSGSLNLSPANDFPAGTAFGGIIFSNTGASFTLSGNSILLSTHTNNALGVTNVDGNSQTINNNLVLDWGYHTFYGPSASVNLNGGILANVGGVADFGANNINSTSYTLDGTGLIAGLGGAGLIGNTGGGANSGSSFSGLATVSGGAVTTYSYSGNQVLNAVGPIGVDDTTTISTTWAVEITALTTGFTRPAVALSTPFTTSTVVNSLAVSSATGVTMGAVVTGTGIPAGVTVTGIAGTTISVSSFTSTAASAGNYTFSQVVTSVVATTPTGIAVGQAVSGTGVPAGVTVTSVTGSTIGVSTFTCTAASTGNYTFAQTGINSIQVGDATGILLGAPVAGTGIPNGVTVTSIAGTTLSVTTFTPTAANTGGNYTFGSTAADPANIQINPSAGSFSLAGGTSTTFGANDTFVNTALLTVSGTTKITTLLVPSGNGTLVLGSTNVGTGMYVGGIYLPGGQTVQEITVGSGTSTFLTAGPMSGNPVPGEIVIAINGDNTSNEGEMNAAIKDNLSGGAVSVVYAGGGSFFINNAGNSYTGGTYMTRGRAQCNNPAALGVGPVFVSGGDAEISLQNVGTGTVSNNFFIYPASSYVGAATEGAIRCDGTGNSTLSGTINLMGATLATLPGSPAGAAAVVDRISTQSADITTFSGQLTGPGTLEFYSGVGTATFALSNIVSGNNWTGGLIIDGVANDSSDIRLLANNQLGTNNVTFIQAGTGFARLDLNGFNDTVGGLTGAANALNQVENFGAGTSTLIIGANNATATFSGIMGDGASGGNGFNLVKVGTGKQTLSGSFSSYSGGTTVGGGTLAFTGTTTPTNSSFFTVTNGATLDLSGLTAPSITSAGALSLTNAILDLAVPSDTTTNFNVGSVNLGGSGNTINLSSLPIATSYPTTIHLVKYGALNGTFNVALGPLPAPPQPLVGAYVGHLTNNPTTSTIDLVLTGGPAPVRSLTWTGTDANNPTFWDVATSVNWKDTNGATTTFNQLDFTTFDDSAPGSTTVNLTTTLTPSSVTVSNNTKVYTFTGGGNISNSITLLKEGTGLLIMDNGTPNILAGTTIAGGTVQVGNNDSAGDLGTGAIVNNGNITFARSDNPSLLNPISGSGGITQSGSGELLISNNNSFNGPITVTTGVLQVGTSNSLGNTNASLTIDNGASLDLNGNNLGSKPIFVSGSGANGSGLGAIDNTGSNVFPAVAFVTLLGDTTFGTSGGNGGSTTDGRWDLRAAGGDAANPTNAMLSTGGQPYNLTITGGALLGIVSATVDPALANIDIQGGKLDFEGGTTGLGDPTKTITIENSGFLFFFAASNALNKNILINSGGTLENNNSVNAIVGPIILNTNSDGSQAFCQFQIDGTTTLNINSAISGGGTLYKNTGTGTLNLNGTNTFTGPILANAGVLSFNGDDLAVTNSTTVTAGTLNVNGELGGAIITTANTALSGSGTNFGLADVSGVFLPGGTNTVGTYTAGGGLIVEGSANVDFDLSNANTPGVGNDLVVVEGDLTFNGGTFNINPFGLLTTGVPYRLFTYSGNLVMNGAPSIPSVAGYNFTLDTSVTGQVNLIASGGPPVWTGGSLTDSDWSDAANFGGTAIMPNSLLYFAGNARLNNTNDTTADTAYGPMQFAPGAGAFTLNGNPLTPVTSILNNSSNPQVLDLGLDFNGSFTLGGGATAASPLIVGGGLTNISAGFATVTLTGNGILTNLLASTPSTGTNTLLMTNLNASWTLLDNATSTPLTIPWAFNIFSGTFTYGSATSAPTVSSTTPNGSPSDNIVGQGAGTFGTFNMVNGNLTLAARLDTGASVAGATGLVNQVGGILTVNGQFQGANIAGGVSTVNVSGGTLNIPGGTTFVASRGHGSLTVSGTAAVNLTTLDVSRGIGDGTIGVVNLNGGTMAVNNISTATANTATPVTDDTASLNLNGGVLKANENNAAFISDSASGPSTAIALAVIVKSGGAIIDDGGFAVSVLEVLQHDATLGVGLDGGLVKQGAGTLTLTLADTYNGGTLVNAGTLAVNGSLGTGPVIVNTNGTLAGTGLIGGAVTVTNGGTLSPGGAATVGTLTVSGNMTNLAGSTNRFLLIRGSSPSNSVLTTSGTVTFAGTLSVTNGGTALVGGDKFKLFNANGYFGSFTSIVPATPGPGLTWDTSNLAVNGTLAVASSALSARIASIMVNGTSLTISGSGGAHGGTFHVLTSMTLTTPVSSWTPFGNGSFNNDGTFTFNGTVDPSDATRFFVLVSP